MYISVFVFHLLVKIFHVSSGLITAANIVIAIVLHRSSHTSFDGRSSDDNDTRDSDSHIFDQRISAQSIRFHTLSSSIRANDILLATKRRTSTQVTRMLLAVTLSLIICNIPNTIFFVFVKIYDTRKLLVGRLCANVSDNDINLYKFGFYSSVIQDILSDLPHIFNFFLYCLAGKKFRSIFINEVHHVLLDFHLIKQEQRRFTQGTSIVKSALVSRTDSTSNQGRLSSNIIRVPKKRKTIEVLFNGQTTKTLLNQENKNLLRKKNHRYTVDEANIRSHTTINKL